MTTEQKEAHERMLASLVVRTIEIHDDMANDIQSAPNWEEKDRALSPEERRYLCEWMPAP